MTATLPGQDMWLDMIATSLAPELHTQTWSSPGAMAAALDLIDQRLVAVAVAVAEGETERQMFSMPPHEGKSQRISVWFPLYTSPAKRWSWARRPRSTVHTAAEAAHWLLWLRRTQRLA